MWAMWYSLTRYGIFVGDYDVTGTVHCDSYESINPSNFDFSGKAVFVSGGSRGLGKAIVLGFAAAGASFIYAAARGDMTVLADEVLATALAHGRPTPHFQALHLDVRDEVTVVAAADVIRKQVGHLDVVINNAGVLGNFGKVADSNPQQWWNVLEVNLRGPYLVARAMLPLLLEADHSYMINVASVGAHLVNPMLSAYQTSKLGLVRLSQLLNREYSESGVTVFSIHPGNVPTEIMGPGELDDFHKSSEWPLLMLCIAYSSIPQIHSTTIIEYPFCLSRDGIKYRALVVIHFLTDIVSSS
jgi:NAD(P)-dependent dehydrogenase (short-subunit alcohol dehydrogenase family)